MGIYDKKLISLLCCFLMLILFPTMSYSFWHCGRPLIALGGGAAFTSDLGAFQRFPFNRPIIDPNFNYFPNRTVRVEPIFDVFLGEEWTTSPRFAVQLGLGYDQTVPFEVNGIFQQGMLPILSTINYRYKYNIRARQILAESKLEYFCRNNIYHPYLFLGLGAGINTAFSYQPYVFFPKLTRQYQDKTTTSFSYSVGLGIDVDMTKCIRLGIGYRFSDFGKASLGRANIFRNKVEGTLSQSHLYTNEVLVQLSIFFKNK